MSEGPYYTLMGFGLALLIFCGVMGFREQRQSWAAFNAAHHCRDVAGGYVCADGAVKK